MRVVDQPTATVVELDLSVVSMRVYWKLKLISVWSLTTKGISAENFVETLVPTWNWFDCEMV